MQVLLAIKSLLKLSSTDVEDFEFYDLDSVLLRLGIQLEDLTPEDRKEFAVEVDALRREVQTLFQQKLKQAYSWSLYLKLTSSNLPKLTCISSAYGQGKASVTWYLDGH